VLNGAELRLAPGDVPPPVVALVEQMLLADPAARPSVPEVHATLMGLRSGTPTVGRAPRPTRAPPTAPAPAATPVAAPPPDPAPARSASRGSALRGCSGTTCTVPSPRTTDSAADEHPLAGNVTITPTSRPW
jgi:hypothetical protein